MKEIESETKHDTKSCELAINEVRRNNTLITLTLFSHQILNKGEYSSITRLTHFGLTSEDVNNLAYAKMFVNVWNSVLVPLGLAVKSAVSRLASKERTSSMLGMTHGQPATPSTFGKEMANFVQRLTYQAIGVPLPRKCEINGEVIIPHLN